MNMSGLGIGENLRLDSPLALGPFVVLLPLLGEEFTLLIGVHGLELTVSLILLLLVSLSLALFGFGVVFGLAYAGNSFFARGFDSAHDFWTEMGGCGEVIRNPKESLNQRDSLFRGLVKVDGEDDSLFGRKVLQTGRR